MLRKKKSKPSADVWYSKGLRFECQQCSACCGGEPGVVWLSHGEAKRIAKRLGISVEEFYDGYTHRVGMRVSLTEKPNGDCIMLQEGKCSIYQERPIQCKTFPWWPWNLETQADWDAVARECPGCNRGKLHSFAEIERERKKRI